MLNKLEEYLNEPLKSMITNYLSQLGLYPGSVSKEVIDSLDSEDLTNYYHNYVHKVIESGNDVTFTYVSEIIKGKTKDYINDKVKAVSNGEGSYKDLLESLFRVAENLYQELENINNNNNSLSYVAYFLSKINVLD